MLIDGEAPATLRIDPSQFMLTKDNHRLMSAPVLSDAAAVNVSPDPVLPRTPEMDDIPEHVQNVEPITPYTRYVLTPHLNKMQSIYSIYYFRLLTAFAFSLSAL